MDTCEHFDLLLESNIKFGIPICHNSSSTFTVFSFLERREKTGSNRIFTSTGGQSD